RHSTAHPHHLTILALWWLGHTLLEFTLGVLLTRYGNLLYWALDRYVLEPLLIRPTEWVLVRLTVGYALLLRWALRHWGLVLLQGAGLVLVALAFFAFDLLG